MDQGLIFFERISEWFASLDLADLLGVIGFFLSVIIILSKIIQAISKAARKDKSLPNFSFKLEDVTHEMFKKKGFVTFDLYIRNEGHSPVEILRTGFVLSDGSEKTIYQEPHKIKLPDISFLQPGSEAFYDNCDLFYTLNNDGICYKKITAIFIDLKDKPRYYGKTDIHPLLNDLTIRGILTDKKGMNGF